MFIAKIPVAWLLATYLRTYPAVTCLWDPARQLADGMTQNYERYAIPNTLHSTKKSPYLTMEIPYAGRAIISDFYDGFEIIIPVKKNWFDVVFSSFWLCGWAYCGTVAYRIVAGMAWPGAGSIFVVFWLCLWAAGGAYTIRS